MVTREGLMRCPTRGWRVWFGACRSRYATGLGEPGMGRTGERWTMYSENDD